MKKPLIVIAGPTASGKTALSISLAKHFDGEIVSADSMQIYKYMDIGTAKPTEEEKAGIPHYMIDIVDPSVNFSAADYCEMAHKVIGDIHRNGKVPIIVGGTGLYIDSLVNNVDFGASDRDPTLRAELENLAKCEGNEAVYKILAEIDPETAAKYHPNNLRRIIRAIEFYKFSGTTISAHAREKKSSPYHTVWFAIDWERDVLYERINRRVDIMIEDGLAEEVKILLNYGYNRGQTAMQGIGYKEFFDYFDGKTSLADTVELIKMNTRRYAKRQLTWFRRNQDIHWLKWSEHLIDTAISIAEEELGI